MLHKRAKFNYQVASASKKLFNKICFMFYAWAFDDVMRFEYLKNYNLIISRMKTAFEVK